MCLMMEERRYVFGRTNILDTHAEEFVSGVSVLDHSRIVYGEKPQRLGVEDPHRLGITFKQQSIAPFGLQQLLLDLFALRDIAADCLQFDDLAVLDHQLNILTNPNLLVLMGSQRQFEISKWDLFFYLVPVKLKRLFSKIFLD